MIHSREHNTETKLSKLEEAGEFCGAITNNNETCIHQRGWGTNHYGEGRCLHHDGVQNGSVVEMYKIPAIEERMEEFLNDKDMYSLDREIALLRSYLELYGKSINVFKEFDIKELSDLGIQYSPTDLNTALNQTTNTIAKLIKIKSDMEISRKFMIELKTVQIMFSKVADVLESEIKDPELKNSIGRKLGTIMLTHGN